MGFLFVGKEEGKGRGNEGGRDVLWPDGMAARISFFRTSGVLRRALMNVDVPAGG